MALPELRSRRRVVDGRPDERIRDLANVVSVVRDGELVVQEGRVLLPVHVPTAEPEPGEAQRTSVTGH